MPNTTENPDTREAFDRIAEHLESDYGSSVARHFGRLRISIGGKTCVYLDGDSLVFKLPEDQSRQALALPRAQQWDPVGRGRLFREWVEVRPGYHKQWPELAHQATLNVRAVVI